MVEVLVLRTAPNALPVQQWPFPVGVAASSIVLVEQHGHWLITQHNRWGCDNGKTDKGLRWKVRRERS